MSTKHRPYNEYVNRLEGDTSLGVPWVRAGVLAATAFTLIVVISPRALRNKAYELFLYTHVILVLYESSLSARATRFTFLTASCCSPRTSTPSGPPGTHTPPSHAPRPPLTHAPCSLGHYVWPSFLVWGLDRVLRLARILFANRPWRARASSATLERVSADCVRVTLARPLRWRPGQSAFLIMPAVSRLPFESHPFTIAGIDADMAELDAPAQADAARKLVFIIRAREGFTQRLMQYAESAAPDARFSAYVDGPYGSPPDLGSYSTVVLIAGSFPIFVFYLSWHTR